MTWSIIIIITLFVAIAVLVTVDGYLLRKQRVRLARLELTINTLLYQLSTRHPSYSGWRHTDRVVADMKYCFTCDGLRPPEHFTQAPTHAKL